MDCVCIPSVEIKGEWVYPSSPNNQEKKASRFSRTPYRNRSLKLSATPEKSSSVQKRSSNCSTTSCAHRLDASRTNRDSDIITRSTSTSSIAGLDVVDQNQGMLIFNGERSVPYGTLLILLLFFASVSSYNSDSQSKSFLFQSSQKNPTDGGNSKINNNRLGSAMIESVTEVFSPILPFTGGIDLRRDGNWRSWRNWFGITTATKPPVDSNNSIVSQKISLFPRGGGKRNNGQDTSTASRKNTVEPTHAITLSTNDPFISTNKISEMTLNEIAVVFRYVIESGRDTFNSKRFLSQRNDGLPLNQRMIDTMQAIDEAASKSRGEDVLPADTREIQFDLTVDDNHPAPLSPEVGYGDVDALQFCAAMRLFAEWRLLRQVPAGYKAYAVGMNLGHKDIVQNVAKIEKAVHEWIQSTDAEIHDASTPNDGSVECTGNSSSASAHVGRRSPTLRQLLVHEINMDTHTSSKLPRLKDGTAAMGLLWVRRQLHYQTVIFRNVISVPEVYPSAIKAVGAAYSEVYDGVHGWAVQKIFNYSFQAAPDTQEIFQHMNPVELARVRIAAAEQGSNDDSFILDITSVQRDLESGDHELEDSHPSLETNLSWQGKQNVSLSTEKENPLVKLGSHIVSEWDKLGSHIVSEWDKLGQNIGGEFDKFTCGIGKIFNHKDSKDCDKKQTIKASPNKASPKIQQDSQQNQPALTGELLEKFINERMTMDARRHITTYLLVAQPLLADLAGLFAEMNMDDPTKV